MIRSDERSGGNGVDPIYLGQRRRSIPREHLSTTGNIEHEGCAGGIRPEGTEVCVSGGERRGYRGEVAKTLASIIQISTGYSDCLLSTWSIPLEHTVDLGACKSGNINPLCACALA